MSGASAPDQEPGGEADVEAFNASVWLVDRHVEAGRGSAVAFRCGDEELTYDGLLAATVRAANGLLALGVGVGDRVLMVVDDELAFPVCLLAGLRIGAVPIPVSTMLRAGDVAALAVDSGAQTVILSGRYGGHLLELDGAPALTDAVVTGPPSPASFAGRVRVHEWAAFAASDRPVAPAATTTASPGFWLYTSGTTGRPKGAIHRHGDLRAICQTYGASVLGVGPGDVCYSVPKLFFAFGLGNAMVFPLGAGATAVIDPEPATPARAAQLLARHHPTLFFAPPGFCAAMADVGLDPAILASARATVTAGEVLPAEVARRFSDHFGTEMLDGIGSTEALHIFCSNHPGRTRPGTSGEPVAGYELRLLDDDGQVITGADTPGALWVKGPSVADGYWQRPELTAATFVDGWLRTGDVYTRSPDGYYRFVGRNSDMIKAGGIWVSPAEVESALLEHNAVLEAAVVGSRNADGLEVTVAFVVPRRGHSIDPDELARFCRSTLPGFKRPRQIHVVDTLPKTATGKIQRFALRDMLAAPAPGSVPAAPPAPAVRAAPA
ncbi:benzoate-CoA ligase family protein [Acidiferrimicrobium sp. IK]|uniref:benzoate-CoA ligase family protein n=1 Tax=Acidiferrimicrobium sp. IK TaxID=2871700 RepID=UPI0021CB6CA4|nr:benzoate-CoA ligase family protein [Acidiferrimicrobium sp. IK]MCU4186848.1 benzoate-CoA ligase family protein [Acidiferrimicrobium sp. IK]